MRLTIDSVIYFYLFICGALLVFNVFYILRSKSRSRDRERRVRRWEHSLLAVFTAPPQSGGSQAHRVLLERTLRDVEELTAFNEVLSHWREGRQAEIAAYFHLYRGAFQNLAVDYGKRNPMERAFFAYVIASFHPPAGGHDMLAEILLGYLEDSTVYCRENVLCALYALGSAQAVEHAFEILNERGWYHHPRLLSDGMSKFNGDRAGLAERLWRNRGHWADYLLVAVVQLAAALPEDAFSEPFLKGLRQEALPLEVRFALVRYFGRHVCAEAKPVLLELLGECGGAEGGLPIAAAAALARYPGEDTVHMLKNALHSRNWYVRRNAAGALIDLGVTEREWEDIRAGGDRYALEMLAYMAGYDMPAEEPPAEPAMEQERAVALV